jgi:PBSX family phage terminase large subunit
MSDTQDVQTTDISRKEAIHALWEMGVLYWKLDENQKQIYDNLKNISSTVKVLACSRRTGKTFMLILIAIERCIQEPGTIVKIIQPQVKMIKRDIRPIIREITKDCPTNLRPEFRVHDNIYHFPNGSEIQLAGSDNGHAESLRGGSAHLCIVDEAGFCTELEYLVQSILVPTTLTTKGDIILSSTPPKEPDHDFVKFVRRAEYENTLIKRTIYDNPRLGEEERKRIISSYPSGENDVQYKREHLCEFVVSEEDAVVPEFTELVQKECIKEWPRPPYYDAYTSADIGFKDLTVVLFAYYDFRNSAVVIEDEYVINGAKMTTKLLAEEIKNKESSLWVDPLTLETRTPTLRVSDNNLILINDLQVLHQLTFLPTRKDDAEASLNTVRLMIAQRRVIINPKCRTLIYHLRNATWNKSRTSYERSPDSGHYDALDALKYLLRNISYHKNPYPSNYDLKLGNSENVFFNKHNLEPQQKTMVQGLKDMFTVKNIQNR